MLLFLGTVYQQFWDQHLIYNCIGLLAHDNVVLKANVKIRRLPTCNGASVNEQLVHLDVEPLITPSQE